MDQNSHKSLSTQKIFLNKKRMTPESSTKDTASNKSTVKESKKNSISSRQNINNTYNAIIYLLDKGDFFKKENKESKENNLSYGCFIQKTQKDEIFFYQYAKYNINDTHDKKFCFRCCDQKCTGIININYTKNIENFNIILPHNIPNERHSYILYPTYGYQIYLDLFKQNKILSNLQLIFNPDQKRLNIINPNHFFKNTKTLDETLKKIDISKLEKEPINISSNNDLDETNEINEISNEENIEQTNSNENSNENKEKEENDEMNNHKRVKSNIVKRRTKIKKRKFIKQILVK